MCVDGKAYSNYVVKTIIGGNGVRRGVAVTGETVSPDVLGDIFKKCNDFVATLGYTGMYDVDLVKDINDHIYFLEVNFRAGASMRAFTGQGINIPDMYLRALRGMEPEVNRRIEVERFVSEKLVLEECASGTMTYRSAEENIAGADVRFIYDADDVEPYREFMKYYRLVNTMKLRR